MKKTRIQILMLAVCALVFSGCAGMSTGGKNPWAPPEKKKSFSERWDEKTKKAEESKKAEPPAKPAEKPTAPASAAPEPAVVAKPVAPVAPAPKEDVVTVAESREIAEVVYAEKNMAVAYRIGGARAPVKKGDVFALRSKDLKLHGVARLDVIDGDTLGFSMLAGTAAVGDLAAIPGQKLLAEMNAAFPQVLPPEPAAE